MAIQPFGDRVLIKHLEGEDKTPGGIILPDTAKEKPQEGKVVAVGKGRLLEDGSLKPLEVRVGDTVLFAKYSGTEILQNEDEYLILREDEILAICGKSEKKSKQ